MKRFLLLILLLPGVTLAAPVTWVLDGVVFDGGSTASGQFDYDADTATVTNANIIVVLGDPGNYWAQDYGDASPTQSFTLSGAASQGPDNIVIGSGTDQGWSNDGTTLLFWELELIFNSSLTNAGGTVNLLGSSSLSELYNDISCGPLALTPDCEVFSETLIAGSVSAVPMPAAVWLFGSALAGLGWLRRNQTA